MSYVSSPEAADLLRRKAAFASHVSNDAGDFQPAPEVPSGNGESRRLLPQENDKTADRDEDEDYNYRLPPMQGRAILIPGLGRLSPVPRHGGLRARSCGRHGWCHWLGGP